MLFLAKNYNYMFEFVKVMPKVLSVPCFPRHGALYHIMPRHKQRLSKTCILSRKWKSRHWL